MIKEISIENYKNLDYLEVKDFGDINIFVGKAGSGKTSLLEAIYLNVNSGDLFNNVNHITLSRGIPFEKDTLHYNFSDFDTNNIIKINSNYSNLEIKAGYNIGYLQSQVLNGLDSVAMVNNAKLESRFYWESIEDDSGMVRDQLNVNTSAMNNRCLFLNSNLSDCIHLLNRFIQVIRLNNKEDLIKPYLKCFSEDILDIESLNNYAFVNHNNLQQRANIGIFGNGFMKYLLIISALLSREFKVICIDELDNALHFEDMKELIPAMLHLVKETETQLFFTTQNKEFLEILSNIACGTDNNDISLFNIARTLKKGMQSYKYDMSDVSTLLDHGTEIRD